jgi:hypothetical protein
MVVPAVTGRLFVELQQTLGAYVDEVDELTFPEDQTSLLWDSWQYRVVVTIRDR